jgi:hypothetical protein
MEMQIIPLANHQAKHFKKFLQSLIQKFQPQQIFCFSENIDTVEQNGCFKTAETYQKCDYCLLMVTETVTRIDHDVQDFANNHYKMGKITILCHGQQTIQEAIRKNNRFFITIYKSAKLLYSHDGLQASNSNIRFIPTQAVAKATKHFTHRIDLANGFLQGAGECLAKQQFTVCSFMLHQVVEQCCIALIRVNIAYRSEIHNLSRMLGLCKSFSEEPYKLFLSGNPEDQRLFDLLVKSYCGARYTSSFSVDHDEATKLYHRVSSFLELTISLCTAHLVKLNDEALAYKELQDALTLDLPKDLCYETN